MTAGEHATPSLTLHGLTPDQLAQAKESIAAAMAEQGVTVAGVGVTWIAPAVTDEWQPSLNIECLARLDLRPDEILAVTVGWSDLTVQQSQEYEEWLAEWFADHGQPVAGVMVLPQGSQLAAIRARQDTASGTLPSSWGGLNSAEIREALESAAAIKHLREGYGL